MKRNQGDWSNRMIHYAPFVLMGGLVVLALVYFRGFTTEEILMFTPENLYLAALVFLCIYVVKSVTLVFPLVFIYVAVGRTYPPLVAVLLNLLGLSLASTIPYLIGRFSGKALLEGLMKRYQMAEKLEALRSRDEWIFSYLLRLITAIPYDVSSIVLGSFGITYWKYITSSLLAKFPIMLAQTYLGVQAREMDTLGIALAVAATLGISIIYALAYRWVSSRHRAAARSEL